MIKHEVGTGRPTENRAINAITNQEVDRWIRQIDEAANTTMVYEKIKAVSDVLWKLVGEIRGNKIHCSVLFTLIGRRNLLASLNLLTEKYGNEWAKEIEGYRNSAER